MEGVANGQRPSGAPSRRPAEAASMGATLCLPVAAPRRRDVELGTTLLPARLRAPKAKRLSTTLPLHHGGCGTAERLFALLPHSVCWLLASDAACSER